MPAVTQYYALLLAVKGNILVAGYGFITNRVVVKQARHRLAIAKVGLDDLRHIVNGDLGIEDALRLDNGDRSLLAKAMAAGKVHRHPLQAQLGYLLFQRLPDFKRLAGDTPRPVTNQDGALIVRLASWLLLRHQLPPQFS
ncbi:hypothetical protein ES708_29750 [subsurface metagenome]